MSLEPSREIRAPDAPTDGNPKRALAHHKGCVSGQCIIMQVVYLYTEVILKQADKTSGTRVNAILVKVSN